MSASEQEEQANEPQSVEERLGESMIPLTQLGLTDPAVPNESDQSSSFNSIAYLYLLPTPRPLMPSVRGSDNDCDIECEVKSVVNCDDSPVASGTTPAASGEPPVASGMFICTVQPATSGLQLHLAL